MNIQCQLFPGELDEKWDQVPRPVAHRGGKMASLLLRQSSLLIWQPHSDKTQRRYCDHIVLVCSLNKPNTTYHLVSFIWREWGELFPPASSFKAYVKLNHTDMRAVSISSFYSRCDVVYYALWMTYFLHETCLVTNTLVPFCVCVCVLLLSSCFVDKLLSLLDRF